MMISIKSKIIKDLLKVLSGNIIAQGIAFLTIILISRDLGPKQYGIFSLLIAIFTISVQISDFGISTSYVKYLSENLSKLNDIFFTIIIVKVVLSFITILIIFFISKKLSFFFFGINYYDNIIKFISLSIIFHSIFNVIITTLQAQQKFNKFALLNILHNLFKFISIVLISIFFVKGLHLKFFLFAYTFSVIFILAIIFFKYKIKVNNIKFNFKHFIEIYKLGFWIFLSSLAVMIMMRLDIIMLQKMSTSDEVGYYSAAMHLAMIFPLITASLVTTILPKMDEFLKKNTIQVYVKKVLSKTKYVLFILIIMELLAPFAIKLFFGEEYMRSISVFQILLVAFIFGIIMNPISLVFYSINKAYLLTIMNWLQFFLNYFGNLLLIPILHANGAALSTVLLKLLGSFFIIIYLFRYIRK